MESLIAAHGITCELANGRVLFERLTFSLSSGITGLVGPNGVGKTHLARILAEELAPGAGAVRRHGTVTLLAQREAPPPALVEQYLGRIAHSPLQQTLLGGIASDARCDRLSGGEWMRVRLARAIDDSFLILDEPSNDLDGDARSALLAFLRNRRGGTLLISHDRDCLELCESILELSAQGLVRYGGGWTEYWHERQQERARQGDALMLAKRQRDRAQAAAQESAAKRQRHLRHAASSAARGGMPQLLLGARKRQAQVTEGRRAVAAVARANEAVQVAYQAFSAMKVDAVMYAGITGKANPAQKLVAQAQAFNIRRGGWLYGTDLDFCWRGSSRLVIRGANGCGKTTLMHALRGQLFETRGSLSMGGLASVCLDQRQSALNDDMSVLENVAACCAGSQTELRNALARFLFTGDTVHQKAASLSGGERLRLALAQSFLQVGVPELMLLDEPTNNLDAANVEFLESIVHGFQGALVVISHDDRFVQRCGVTEELVLDRRAPQK